MKPSRLGHRLSRDTDDRLQPGTACRDRLPPAGCEGPSDCLPRRGLARTPSTRIVADLPTIRTLRLVLRPFSAADAPDVQRLAGAPEVAGATLNIPHPYEDGMAEAWIATLAPAFTNLDMAAFAIALPDGRLIGAISLRLEPRHRRAELGYWIGVPFWGHGYATEAAQAIVEYGFQTLALNRIHATHLLRNPASGKVMDKIGMRYEGIHRQHVWKDGQFEDLVRYAILRGDQRSAAT